MIKVMQVAFLTARIQEKALRERFPILEYAFGQLSAKDLDQARTIMELEILRNLKDHRSTDLVDVPEEMISWMEAHPDR